MAHPREGNEKHHSTYNIEKKIPILEKKTWFSKLGCHGNVNIDVHVMTTLDIFFRFYTYALSMTVLTMWMVDPKMFYKSHRT